MALGKFFLFFFFFVHENPPFLQLSSVEMASSK